MTGGASGIGADIVRAFAANDAKVAFVDIQDDAGSALAKETGGALHQCRHHRHREPQAAIAKTRETLGPVGILVNNAANDDRHKIDEVTVEYWDHALDVNLRQQFFAAQAVRPQMKELGERRDHQFLLDRLEGRRRRFPPTPPPRPASSASPARWAAPSAPTTSASTPSSRAP